MTNPVRFAFLGAGAVSELHFDGVRTCADAELVGLYDPDPDTASRRARQYGEVGVYASVDELLADDSVDVVSVLSPYERHAEQVVAALQAGRHVLVEKPVGASVAEVARMRDAAAHAGRVCMPAHNYLYEPGIQRSRRLIAEGALGHIAAVFLIFVIHHPEEMMERYPGVVRQIFPHFAYITQYLLGMPRRLVVFKSTLHYEKLERENQAAAILELPDGVLAQWFVTLACDDHTTAPWTILIKVLGTEGGTAVSWRDHVITRPGPHHAWTFATYPWTIESEVQYLVEEVIRKGRPPLATIDDAVETQRLIHAAEESVVSGSAVSLES